MCEQFKLHAGLVPVHPPKPSVSRVFCDDPGLHHGCCGWVVLGTDCVVKAILQRDRAGSCGARAQRMASLAQPAHPVFCHGQCGGVGLVQRGAPPTACSKHRTLVSLDMVLSASTWWRDPKGGELYPATAKPCESVVEAGRSTDVQIVRRSWA